MSRRIHRNRVTSARGLVDFHISPSPFPVIFSSLRDFSTIRGEQAVPGDVLFRFIISYFASKWDKWNCRGDSSARNTSPRRGYLCQNFAQLREHPRDITPAKLKCFSVTPSPPLPLNLSLFFTKKRWRLRHFVRVDLEHRYAPSRDPVPIRSIPIFILLLGSLSFETFLFWGNIYIYRVWRACRNNWYDEFLISSIHVQVIWIERIIS